MLLRGSIKDARRKVSDCDTHQPRARWSSSVAEATMVDVPRPTHLEPQAGCRTLLVGSRGSASRQGIASVTFFLSQRRNSNFA